MELFTAKSHVAILKFMERQICGRKFYPCEMLEEAILKSRVPIYLLMCIFEEISPEVEISVLKVLHELLQNYGIRVDTEGNL